MSENKKKTDEEVRMIKDQDETLVNEQMESIEGGLCDNGGKLTCKKIFNYEKEEYKD